MFSIRAAHTCGAYVRRMRTAITSAPRTMDQSKRTVTPATADICVSDDVVQYPENHLLAIFETGQQVAAATKALTANGFLASELSVACGKAAADSLAATTGRSGITGLVIRIAKGLGLTNEEAEVKDHFTQALREGKLVLSAHVEGDERKAVARRIVLEMGAGSVIFLGQFTIEVLQR